MFGKLLTNQKIAYKIFKPYVYKALREGLKTHDNGKIQNLRGFDSLPLRRSTMTHKCSINFRSRLRASFLSKHTKVKAGYKP